MADLTVLLLGTGLLVAAVPLLVLAVIPAPRPGASPRRLNRPVEPQSERAPRYPVPRSELLSIERNLQLAGLTTEWSLRTIVTAKVLLAALGAFLGVLIVAVRPSPLAVLFALAICVGGYFVPDLIVLGRARERQDLIQSALADTLDHVLISIEAGVGLETAVARAGRHGSGALATELARTVQDMRLGSTRREAYTALASRTSVVDLQRFARAIMQADAYGVSIGGVVRSQAKELRVKRRQRAEEKAARVPVQVLFPLMFCILPVLFIVVLAPAVINLVESFGVL